MAVDDAATDAAVMAPRSARAAARDRVWSQRWQLPLHHNTTAPAIIANTPNNNDEIAESLSAIIELDNADPANNMQHQ